MNEFTSVRRLRFASLALLWGSVFLGSAPSLLAQDAVTKAAEVAPPPSTLKTKDVTAINRLVEEFYSAISSPSGGKLDRKRLRPLFVSEGRIASVRQASSGRPARVVVMSPDEYADGSDMMTAKSGFFDRVLSNRVEMFGSMAHVYSAYESRTDPRDDRPLARGIKSFELLQNRRNLANRSGLLGF